MTDTNQKLDELYERLGDDGDFTSDDYELVFDAYQDDCGAMAAAKEGGLDEWFFNHYQPAN